MSVNSSPLNINEKKYKTLYNFLNKKEFSFSNKFNTVYQGNIL